MRRGSILWKRSAVVAIALAFAIGIVPRSFAGVACMPSIGTQSQSADEVFEKLVEIGVAPNKARELIQELSISEIEYLISNPDLLQELGAYYESEEEAEEDARLNALIGLVLLGFTLSWMTEMQNK